MNEAVYLEQRTDDVETLFQGEADENWDWEYLQLSAGPLGARIVVASLPGLSIHWSRWSARVHARECLHPGVTHLGFLLDASGNARWYGKTLDRNDALLYFASNEQDYILPRNVQSLGFTFSDSLRDEMGWELEQTPLHNVSEAAIHSASTFAKKVTMRLQRGNLEPHEAEILQERLLLRLADLLEPWMRSDGRHNGRLSPSRQYQLANMARRKLQKLDYSKKPDIQALANELGISPRSLHRVFNNCFGVGPYEYCMLLRFHAFRRALRAVDKPVGAITNIATAIGFTHLGRFSTLYRKYYGERPRESLQRWMEAV